MSRVDDPDLTRKQRREQARGERKALEEQHSSQGDQRKRLIQLGGVAVVAIAIIAIILVATGSGGSKNAPPPKSAAATQAETEVTKLLQGIPQSANTLGSSSAPVTIQYFGDLECPICKEFTLGALPALIEKYVRPGKLKIEYRSMQTATREQEIFRNQQIAALAAGKQQRMWNYIELFYHEQGEEGSGYVTEHYLQGLASQIPGLNLSDWSSARSETSFNDQVTTDAQAANQAGFTGTPSFLIAKAGATPKDLKYASLTDPSSFEEAINKQLKG
jgi:protein-disulfide isomerase